MKKKMLTMWALRLALICFGSLTAWAAPGDVDTGFLNSGSGANNDVLVLAMQPDGKIVIGGFSITVNGVARVRIARLNADGTLDTTFSNGLTGAGSRVFAVAVHNKQMRKRLELRFQA